MQVGSRDRPCRYQGNLQVIKKIHSLLKYPELLSRNHGGLRGGDYLEINQKFWQFCRSVAQG